MGVVMHLGKLFLLAGVVALAAGCTLNTQESTSSGNERSLSVDVPSGTMQLKVDTTATAQAGTPDVTVLVKDDAGNLLGSHTFAVSGTTSDQLTVDVHGQAHLTVVAKVVDGDATLDVRVTAVVPGQPEVIVVQQTIVITTQVQATTTSTVSTPSTTTTTPTPTPPANATNNSTNSSV